MAEGSGLVGVSGGGLQRGNPGSEPGGGTGGQKNGRKSQKAAGGKADKADAKDRHGRKPLGTDLPHGGRQKADHQYGEPETGRNGGSAPVQSFLTDQAQNLLSGSAQAAQEAEKFRPLRGAAVQAAGNHQNGCQHHKDREKKGNLVNPGHGGPFQLPLETQKTGMNVNLFIGKLILLLYLCDHLCDGAK